MAERAKISVSYLSMLERSKRDPALSSLKRVADALGMPLEILFFLGAESGELTGLNKELAGQLAYAALEMLNEPQSSQTSLPL